MVVARFSENLSTLLSLSLSLTPTVLGYDYYLRQSLDSFNSICARAPIQLTFFLIIKVDSISCLIVFDMNKFPLQRTETEREKIYKMKGLK